MLKTGTRAPGSICYRKTDEDIEIVLGLKYIRQGGGAGVHAYFRTLWCDDFDAAIMARLARTRKNNRHARAYAGGAS